jgi:hypothetical protein
MRVSSRRADEEATAEGGHERASASPSPSLSSSDDDGYDHDRDDEDDEGQDHETGAIHGQPSAPAAPGTAASGAPPKKKRTRTLTTPYQAQRLHELLAKVTCQLALNSAAAECILRIDLSRFTVTLPHDS